MGSKIAAWSVHLLTASGAVVALLTLSEINQHHFINALWLMAVAIFIDAIDGTLARLFHVKTVVPKIDGALLDNIIDYLNYVITPCFFLLIEPNLLSGQMKWFVLPAVCLSSAYQFTQSDAKTTDHFFKGFPCYWNLVVMYLYLFSATQLFSCVLLLLCSLLVFVPIKYVYPSRLDYLTEVLWLKFVMFAASLAYGIHCALMIHFYPNIPLYLIAYSAAYIIFYITFSVLRTVAPLIDIKKKRML